MHNTTNLISGMLYMKLYWCYREGDKLQRMYTEFANLHLRNILVTARLSESLPWVSGIADTE